MPAFNAISPTQLNRLIGTPEPPAIVDVCLDEDVAAHPHIVPTAIRHSHLDLAGLTQRLGARHAVIICQKGRKLSQGVAAWLRASGRTADYLEGGMQAWAADPETPSLPLSALPQSAPGSLWVTRQRPKIDRIACPWLIRRFVDPEALFLFVAADEVTAVAERFGALPFDVDGSPFSHRDGACSFDSFLDTFALHTPALDRLALVIRGADTNRHDLDPVCAGLLAISVGMSRQYATDSAHLEAGFAIYDALYRWARDGSGETHEWPLRH